jgi:VanZ family protein
LASGLYRRHRLLFFLRYWLPLLGYVGLIFTLSAQPYLQGPLHFHNADKLEHLCEYGGLGLLLIAMLRASNPARPVIISVLLAVACGMAIGAADENFQRLTPGRSCDLYDWFADSTGVILAQCVAWIWARSQEI